LVYVTYGRGSVLLWQRCDTLCTSGFTNDVIFAHDGDAKMPHTQSNSEGVSADLTPRPQLKLNHWEATSECGIYDCLVIEFVKDI